jgi:hypothetical protein
MQLLLTVAWFIALASSAQAEPARLLRHDNTSMTLSRTANGIEISYAEIPPALRELGVGTGTVLVRGKWDDTILVGEAFTFQKGCPPISYPIRGVIDRSGALIVIGPMPTSCGSREYAWSDGAVMRFEPPREASRTEPRAAKPKPKPKPRPAPQRQLQPQPQPNPWQQWRW